LENACATITSAPDFGPHARQRFSLLKNYQRVYSSQVFQQANDLIRQAHGLTASGPSIYQKRVDFVHAGLKFTQLMVANLPLMTRIRESESAGKDKPAITQVTENWQAIKELCDQAGPIAIHYKSIMAKMQGTGYMGMMEDYFGPPSDKLIKSGGAKQKGKKGTERTDID